MLGLFGAKPNHPLADNGEVKRVLGELAAAETRTAVGDATAWLESLASAEGFRLGLLAERLAQFDQAVFPQARRLARDFVHLERHSRAAREIWDLAYAYWAQLTLALEQAIARYLAGGRDNDLGRDAATRLFAAVLHARAAMQKWQEFHMREPHESFWRELGGHYQVAVDLEIARRPLELHVGAGVTTVEAECLKILLMHVAALDKLSALEIEIGERLIGHFLPHFGLTREVRPENVYWVDFSRAEPPTRLARLPEVSPHLHFFSGAHATPSLEALVGHIDRHGVVPPEVNLGGQYQPEVVRRVGLHLAQSWAPKPPMRAHVRRPLRAPVVLTHGLGNALQTIAYAASTARTRVSALEVWAVSDISLGGMAIEGDVSTDDWPRVGALVALLPEGGPHWLVGVVRRVSHGKGQAVADEGRRNPTVGPKLAHLGVETLARGAHAVVADAQGLAVDVLVLDPPVLGESARVVLPPNVFDPTVALVFLLLEKEARLHMTELLESGPDYVLVRCLVQRFA